MQNSHPDKNQMFALIKRWEESDLTQKAYCEQTDIRYHVFHYWYRQYKDRNVLNTSTPPSFVSLKVDPFPTVSAELVMPNGKRLLFHQPVNVQVLKALLQ
jgi:hypothetical protein